MADDVGVLFVKVTADTTELINKTQADALAAGKKASKGFGKKFAAGMALAGAAVGAAAVGITKSVIDLGREYEDNMLKMQAVTNATGDEMVAVAAKAKELGNNVALPGVSAAGAADAMLQLGKAGFTAQEAMDAATGTMQLAVAAQMDEATAAEITANAVGAFNLEAQESARVADLLAKGSTSAATTVYDLGMGMKQASANFAAAGVPIEDLITSMSLMANAGVKGSDAGTSLKTMLQKLTAPTDESAKAMKKLGVNVFDSQGELKSMEKLVEEFSKATANMTEEQRAQAITTIFGADASRAANIVLTQGVEKYKEMSNAMRDAGGSAEKLAEATSSGLSGAIEGIQSTLETIAIDIFDNIKGPLTDVINGISEVVQTLTPVLTAIGTTLGGVATDILGSLASAFTSLVPAMQPILDTFAMLGSRLGPLVGKVLQRLGQILERLFQVVGPVLDVLITLVFEILDAAWPIIELVTDVLMILIDALSPLFDAVLTLLKPITQLVMVVFKAIMPILQPLMPIIELLAWLLGQILVRAIGVLMGSIGLLVKAWAKAGEFILDKFIDPVMDAFFSFVGSMVKGAAEAFGWVPGLGGQLQDAADNFSQWETDTKKAIKGAATTAVKEADKIADSLIESSKTMIVEGKSDMYEGGKELGKNVGQGLVDGMYFSSSDVYSAGEKLGNQATYGARFALQTHSPSKVFERIGNDVADGFVQGVEKHGMDEKMAEQMSEVVEATLDSLNDLRSDAKRILDQSVADFKDYALEVKSALIGDAADPTVAMQKTKNQQDEIVAAQERLNELRAQLANAKGDPSESLLENIRVAESDLGIAQAAARSFEENFQAGLDLSRAFAESMNQVAPVIASHFDMTTPEGRALYEQMIGGIMAAGPEVGMATAQAISAGLLSPDAFHELTKLDAFAGEVGLAIADKSKGEGAREAALIVKGIDKKMKSLKPELVKIGAMAGDGMVAGLRSKVDAWAAAVRAMVKATKDELKIQSPSKVFMEIGEYSGQGFTQGFASTASATDIQMGSGATPKASSFSVSGESIVAKTTAPEVRVFIGEQELTDIVRTEVDNEASNMGRSLLLGRY